MQTNLATKAPVQAPVTLGLWDAVGLIVGIVIGAGIFETPAFVAANADSPGMVLWTWALGGAMSLVGALCYAELATAYPHPGGNYFYLQRAFGSSLAFLFAWARMTVIQTGSIVLLAFVFGDYMSQLWRLGTYSSSIYAVLAILLLTGANVLGVRQGTRVQNALAIAQVGGLLLVIIAGLFFTQNTAVSPPAATSDRNVGLTLVFVLLTYGGWNEAAYISAELKNVQRNMTRSLLLSLGVITAVYLLVNAAFLHGLGQSRMAGSEAVAADLMQQAFGTSGVVFISGLVAVATLCSINATIFTGARTNFALGQDYRAMGWMGHWNQHNSVPLRALWVQTAIALLLVVIGALSRKGFQTMVDYTAPVFWLFFLLVGVALLVLRRKDAHVERPFRVPLYPVVPLLFCAICLYMLHASIAYTGWGGLLGLAVLILGLPVLWWEQRIRKTRPR